MRTGPRHQTVLLTFLVAALFLRVAGVHLHVCYDGQEPPTTLHLADAGLHDDHDTGPLEHRDLDVQLESVVAKSAKLGFDLPAISGPTLLLPVLHGLLQRVAVSIDGTIVRTRHDFLRPPLRAPPR